MSSKSIITFFMIVLMTLFGIGQSGICEDMCKEVGAYPKCNGCPGYAPPDKKPGVRTWQDVLDSMDRLSENGGSTIKGWKKQA